MPNSLTVPIPPLPPLAAHARVMDLVQAIFSQTDDPKLIPARNHDYDRDH